jgi:hypothetical protein
VIGTLDPSVVASGVAGIDVTVYAPDGLGDWGYVNDVGTDTDGTYSFGGLPTGTYRVEFYDPHGDYVDQYYNDKATLDAADGVPVSAGATTSGIDATLVKAGTIGDTTKPVTTSSFNPAPGAVYSANQPVTLTPTDNVGGSGVKVTYYKIDSGSWTSGTSFTVTGDGLHTFSYYSADNADNTETVNVSNQFRIDTTAPVTTCNAVGGHAYVGAQTFTLSPTDVGGSGVASTSWQLDSTSGTWNSGTSVAVAAPATGSVSHTLYFHSRDVATNTEATKQVTFSVAAASAPVYQNVYRFRNLKNGFYLWTASEAEKNNIVATLSKTWTLEGVAYRIDTVTNTSPLWRFRNIRGGFYLYTADAAEKNHIVATLSKTWVLEGVAYDVSTDPSGAPVWRFRNLKNGTYLYSADANEKNTIVATLYKTWLLEGPAYYLAP